MSRLQVTPRARSRADRAGDPLDGLVNLFDLGIVLAVAFLLAALSSLHLSNSLANSGKPTVTIPVKPGQTIVDLPPLGGSTSGRGVQVGTVYQLPDGRLVYVTGKAKG